MRGGLHGEDVLTFVVRDLVHSHQQGVVSRAAVANGEGLDHGPPFGVDDARHMAALGNVDSNDKHKQTPALRFFPCMVSSVYFGCPGFYRRYHHI